jgi:hypothetical protein
VAAHEENSWPPTGINLSVYKDLAVAADIRLGRWGTPQVGGPGPGGRRGVRVRLARWDAGWAVRWAGVAVAYSSGEGWGRRGWVALSVNGL